MSRSVITLEEDEKGQATVYAEVDEKQKGFLKNFTNFIFKKVRLGDNVLAIRTRPPPVVVPPVEYRDRVIERVVEKVVYKDKPEEESVTAAAVQTLKNVKKKS